MAQAARRNSVSAPLRRVPNGGLLRRRWSAAAMAQAQEACTHVMTVSPARRAGRRLTSACTKSMCKSSKSSQLRVATASASSSSSTPSCAAHANRAALKRCGRCRKACSVTHHVPRAHEHSCDGEHAAAAAKVHHNAVLHVAQPVRDVQDTRCYVRACDVPHMSGWCQALWLLRSSPFARHRACCELLQRYLRLVERVHVLQQSFELLELHRVGEESRPEAAMCRTRACNTASSAHGSTGSGGTVPDGAAAKGSAVQCSTPSCRVLPPPQAGCAHAAALLLDESHRRRIAGAAVALGASALRPKCCAAAPAPAWRRRGRLR